MKKSGFSKSKRVRYNLDKKSKLNQDQSIKLEDEKE